MIKDEITALLKLKLIKIYLNNNSIPYLKIDPNSPSGSAINGNKFSVGKNCKKTKIDCEDTMQILENDFLTTAIESLPRNNPITVKDITIENLSLNNVQHYLDVVLKNK